MNEKSVQKTQMLNKLLETKPHLSVVKANEIIDRLLQCDERLFVNIKEWMENENYTDIWIRDKYCIGALLKMRRDNDFVSAIIALDEYAKDESKEFALWQVRA